MPLDQPVTASQKFGLEVRMTFGEHIEELRRRLILAIVGMVIAAVVTLTPMVTFRIIGWIAQPFVQVLDAMGFPPQTFAREPTMGFGIYMKVGLISAIILSSPWVIYQLWLFITAGLYEHEKRMVHILAPFSTLMTVLAVLFTRYILLPITMMFFVNFATWYPQVDLTPGHRDFMVRMLMPQTVPDAVGDKAVPQMPRIPVLAADPLSPQPPEGSLWINGTDGKLKTFFDGRVHNLSLFSRRLLEPLPDLGHYLGFAAMLGLGNVIAFQVPVFMLVLGWTGLVDPAQVARLRRYALLACAGLAAILTPGGDALTMLVMLVPLYGLFELGLLLMRMAFREAVPDGED